MRKIRAKDFIAPFFLTLLFVIGVFSLAYMGRSGGYPFETETDTESEATANYSTDTLTETEETSCKPTETETERISETESDIPTDTATETASDTETDIPVTEKTEEASESEYKKPEKVIIENVPYISQYPDYENGCESVSTVMVLNYMGIGITIDEFIDSYLPQGKAPYGRHGGNPYNEYCGNPRSEYGWGCYALAIKQTLNKFVDSSAYRVKCLHDVTMAKLCANYIDKGIPVVLWVTEGMTDDDTTRKWTADDGTKIEYPRRLHVMVLVGYDNDSFYFADPEEQGEICGKYVKYSKSAVIKAYRICSRQAIVIAPAEEGE